MAGPSPLAQKEINNNKSSNKEGINNNEYK